MAAAVMMGTIIGCSGGGDEVERSAESFCGRWTEFESGAASGQEMFDTEEAHPEFLRELADRSPDPDLAAALDEMAALSPRWREESGKVESGPERENPPDLEVIDRYLLLVREMTTGIERVCGDR